jgi:hypothetical protein
MKGYDKETEPQNEGQFIRIFNNVRRNTELNSNSKLILSHIISYQMQGKEFFMSNKRIGYEYGFSESTAARAIKTLQPYLNKRKERVQLKGGGHVVTIRYLSVKNLNKWVATITPKPKQVNMNYINTTTIDEFFDWANSTFKNKGYLEAFLNTNDDAFKHLESLHGKGINS